MELSKHRLILFANPKLAFEDLPRTRGVDITSEAVALTDTGEGS